MPLRVGLVVNPVAGIGGPAGLKGSDDRVVEAVEKGYAPTAAAKAERFLRRLAGRAATEHIRLYAAPGVLGGDVCRAAGVGHAALGTDTGLHDPFATDVGDTEAAAEEALRMDLDLIVFVGGDGTGHDLMQVVGTEVPILGVPAGVKMFSECFAETPESAADLVSELVRRTAAGEPVPTAPAEVLDLDEDAYRSGRMEVRHHGTVRVPVSPRVQSAKCPACPQDGLPEAAGEIRLRMEDEPDRLFLFGGGSTTRAVEAALGVEGSLIGIDVVERDPDATAGTGESEVAWRVRALDADAKTLEALVDEAKAAGRDVVLVVSPIGGQGFVVGRGTGPLTPKVLKAVLPDGLWVLATTGKLDTVTDGTLHVDTADPSLDATFPDFLRVVVGLGREKMMRVAKASDVAV